MSVETQVPELRNEGGVLLLRYEVAKQRDYSHLDNQGLPQALLRVLVFEYPLNQNSFKS